MKKLSKISLLFFIVYCLAISSCEKEDITNNPDNSSITKDPLQVKLSSASIGIVGDPTDVTPQTSAGTLLMGGSTDVDEAMVWMINKSGGGDIVVLRASGTDAYNQYLFDLGTVNSVETLLINSRTKANNTDVETTIRNAEAVFIAGGDQYDYVSYWKDTKVESALNYLRNTKKVLIGGTSAGCAIQGGIYFDASNGTITSREALRNPYDSYLTLQKHNFIDNPFLRDVITDTHYDNPDRRGRHVTFLARINKDWGIRGKGIGIDERTAVCIDENGKARVFGVGYAFFLNQYGSAPERCVSRQSLDWYRNRRAVEVYKVSGNASGSNYFWLDTWDNGSGGDWQFFYVDRGRLKISY
ncbi:cyanophycinase [uncultured Aquimarina sp.]|uniref:cyanophycinase n=1 Tax=uncultured Aquimarina sp. TaxID=575652 RepID=UPI00262E9666|nr:cyanophycinase [uncultured Aquimarina sp.]